MSDMDKLDRLANAQLPYDNLVADVPQLKRGMVWCTICGHSERVDDQRRRTRLCHASAEVARASESRARASAQHHEAIGVSMIETDDELVKRLREETSPEHREEILAKGWDAAVRSLYDEIKRTGEHGDYQRLIFESWIIDDKDDLLREAANRIASLTARVSELEQALKQFADCVFYDNGDATISGWPGHDAYVGAYFILRKRARSLIPKP